jgi:3-methylfumaryl-CoA hydratase
MTSFSDAEIVELRASIGATKRLEQYLDPTSIERFAVAIGSLGASRTLPPLGHWAYFHDIVPDAEIGADGHPRRGTFLPELPTLPRRMFAAARITFFAPLVIDQMAEMILRIVDLRHKAGRSGDLVFIDVERRISQKGLLCLIEVQTYVYMAIEPTAMPLPIPTGVGGPAIDSSCLWVPCATNLFRFSAATSNGHRIHYDTLYATEHENYPALVVQGPFIAARLAALAYQQGSLASFEFRATAPGFVDQPIRLAETGIGELTATRCDKVVMMTAKAIYR